MNREPSLKAQLQKDTLPLPVGGLDACLNRAMNQVRLRRDPECAQQRARSLVFQYGWDATAYQILNAGMLHWFTRKGDAVVGYVKHFNTRVAAGAPICEEARLGDVAARFEEDAARCGEGVCWFAATQRLQGALSRAPRQFPLVIGAQPVWSPKSWPEIVRCHTSLRAQLKRAQHKGVSVSEWSPEQGAGSVGLQQCLDDWLAHHRLPTLRFLTAPVALDRLGDRRLFVAEIGNLPMGYLIATPIPSRNGWLVEQLVRSQRAPNGTSELLVDAAMMALAGEGYEYLTLGMAPLSERERGALSRPPLWLRGTLFWARRHGRRFYNFEGLDAFKAKFKPESWEPLFLLSNDPQISPRTLIATLAAFSDGPLHRTVVRALATAILEELSGLKR